MKRKLLYLGAMSAILLSTQVCFAAERLPASLFFVANEGQWEEPFAFKAAVGNAVYYVTPTGMTMDIWQYDRPQRTRDPMDRLDPRHEQEPTTVRGHVLRFTFLNANPSPEIIGEDKLSSYSNYFLGRDSCKWRSFVGHYQTVRMKNVWPGIDVVQKVHLEGVETLYRVQAGADAQQISVQVEGLTAPLRVDGAGNLILSTSLGTVKEKTPFAYQIVNHRQVEVPVRFHTLANDSYSLSFEAFDAGHELVVDPLLYGTFLGGYGPESVFDLAIDQQGRKVVVGDTDAGDFPVTPGAYQTHLITADGFVTLFTAAGDSLVFSTYLGAHGGTCSLRGVAFDAIMAVYVGGMTTSPSWPLTPDAFDTVSTNGRLDGVLVRLSADGARLEFSSYLGGDGSDNITCLRLDATGLVYLAGETWEPGFPITNNALFPHGGGGTPGFLTVFNPASSSITYSTFIPGDHIVTPYAMFILSPGCLWLAGHTTSSTIPVTTNAFQFASQGNGDGFFSLWDLNANRLVYCSYLGGEGYDYVQQGLAPLNAGRVVLCGGTESRQFPVTSSAFDTSLSGFSNAFATVVDTALGLVASTFLGGSHWAGGYAVFADSNQIVAVGYTGSADFPITPGAYDSLLNGNGQPADYIGDAFITRLSPDLSRVDYSTFLGGSGDDYPYGGQFAGADTVWLYGQTGSGDFPVTPRAFQTVNHGVGDGCLVGFVLPPMQSSVGHREGPLPQDFSLTIYPNPFNPSTTISFSLSKASPVQFDVFDILGRTVYRADLGRMNAGTHQQLFSLPGLASGMYIVRLNAGANTFSRKMIVMK